MGPKGTQNVVPLSPHVPGPTRLSPTLPDVLQHQTACRDFAAFVLCHRLEDKLLHQSGNFLSKTENLGTGAEWKMAIAKLSTRGQHKSSVHRCFCQLHCCCQVYVDWFLGSANKEGGRGYWNQPSWLWHKN